MNLSWKTCVFFTVNVGYCALKFATSVFVSLALANAFRRGDSTFQKRILKYYQELQDLTPRDMN
jgi:hypothetical protein